MSVIAEKERLAGLDEEGAMRRLERKLDIFRQALDATAAPQRLVEVLAEARAVAAGAYRAAVRRQAEETAEACREILLATARAALDGGAASEAATMDRLVWLVDLALGAGGDAGGDASDDDLGEALLALRLAALDRHLEARASRHTSLRAEGLRSSWPRPTSPCAAPSRRRSPRPWHAGL